MVSLHMAAACLVVASGGDTVLLDFQADWCGPCRAMSATVDAVAAAGYPIRKVNYDRERDLAARYQVQALPCFVLLVNGQVAERISGPTSRGELEAMFARAGVRPTRAAASAKRPDPFAGRSATSDNALSPRDADIQVVPVRAEAADFGRNQSPIAERGVSFERLIRSTVRLTIEDPQGVGYGTGTIIDARDGESLVLTCGHLFRDSHGKGRISVDLCSPGAPRKLPGQLIAYDLKRDLGLVSIRPGVPVTTCRIAPAGYTLRQGAAVLTAGCNHGREATVEQGKILAVDRFVGEPNVQVSGQPVQGRSGGGLFTSDGQLIGVCNAADPTDDAGLYSALGAIHDQLKDAQLAFISADSKSAVAVAETPAVVPVAATNPVNATEDARPRPLSAAERATLVEIQRRSQGGEVICIVRPSAPGAKSEVFVLDQASPALLELLAREPRGDDGRRLTSLEVPRDADEAAESPSSQRGARY